MSIIIDEWGTYETRVRLMSSTRYGEDGLHVSGNMPSTFTDQTWYICIACGSSGAAIAPSNLLRKRSSQWWLNLFICDSMKHGITVWPCECGSARIKSAATGGDIMAHTSRKPESAQKHHAALIQVVVWTEDLAWGSACRGCAVCSLQNSDIWIRKHDRQKNIHKQNISRQMLRTVHPHVVISCKRAGSRAPASCWSSVLIIEYHRLSIVGTYIRMRFIQRNLKISHRGNFP